MYTLQYRVYSENVQRTVNNVQCTVNNVQFTVTNAQCKVNNVQCTVNNVQWSEFRLLMEEAEEVAAPGELISVV